MKPMEAYTAIRRYEESVGRAAKDSAARRLLPKDPSEIDGDSLRGFYMYAEKCVDWFRFGIEIKSCIEGSMQSSSTLMVMRNTPEILQRCGISDAPWLHTQRHVRNELHPKDEEKPDGTWHGLTERQLRLLPELLENPCVVLDNPMGKKGVVCVLEEKDADGLPIIVPFVPDGHGWYRGRDTPSNFILSVYGRYGIADYLSYAGEQDRILYIDKQKSESLLASSGLLLPETCQRLPDKEIIRQSRQIVNGPMREYAQVNTQNRASERWQNGLSAEATDMRNACRRIDEDERPDSRGKNDWER